MGLYAKYIWPRLVDLGMRNAETTRLRAAWIPHARGEVLEVGIGSGLNLAHYSHEVRHVYGVDPSLELQRMARRRIAEIGRMPVEFLLQSAEQPLPLGDFSMDSVVVTWSLCSIPDVAPALAEMRRVLKPNGHLIFLEHGRAPDARVAEWQDRLTPLWRRISGGCHLNRKVDALIEAAGFHITELQTSYIHGPRLVTYTYQGFAQPR
jgi:ubiquinone/menaquinone biosynthesis C-methylase UbiE